MNSIVFQSQKLIPSKVVCIGRNYVAHIEELNNEIPEEPVVFLKPNSAISSQLQINEQHNIHYESEISFLVINGELSGVGFGLDLTKREVQTVLKNKGLPWERAKAFDKSAVFSEFVGMQHVTESLRIELTINGELVQRGEEHLMINSPSELLEEVSRFMTVENGDILMTGTPSGVGIVNKGDVFQGRILSGTKLLIEHAWSV